MKKTLLLLLLTLCMVLCFAAFTASAEETPHEHCVCGGTPIDADYHSCADVTWQPLPEGTTDFGTLAKGNYYLTGDVTVTAYSQIKVDLKICLNGHNIDTTTARVFGNTRTSSGKLTVTDCSYDAATKTWGGTITGGDSSSGYGSIIYTHYSSTVNIYGGNWTGNDTHTRVGGLIVVAQDGAPDTKDADGNVTLKGTSKPEYAATLNLYGGKLYGGLAGNGGNIYVMHCGKMNMYGGIVTEGVAKYTYYTSNGSTLYKVAQGGNIYTDSGTVVHIYDGEISGGIAQDRDLSSGSSVGSGGNIYACGELYIHGGVIRDGHAQGNTRLKDGAYKKSSSGGDGSVLYGRGGNIYSTRTLEISGGQIYGGKANGNAGGNIYYNAKSYTFTISGGMIWGGEANADKSEKGVNIVNAYDVGGGSVRIQYGTFNMTGGSIGIDAEGKPAGGTTYPSGSEGGNIYFYSSSITANLSGGKIAYGNVTGLDAEGNEVYGLTAKGGNIGGGAKATYSDNIEVFGGYTTGNGGNITMFNNGNAKIKGGKIYGGKSLANGGNISMSGDGTAVHTLEITGGEIYGGTAVKGGNIYIEVYKAVEISGNVKIYDGVATTAGGNIGMYNNSKLDISEGVKLTGSETLQTNGANIYASGTITINIDGAEIVGGYTTGNGANIFTGSKVTLSISNSTVKDGKSDKNGGCNLYATGKVTLTNVAFSGGNGHSAGGNVKFSTNASEATVTGCTFEGGVTTTTGGNLYSEGVMTLENCTFKNGQAGTFGGNLSVGKGSVTTVTNCTFEDGSAVQKGGNVYTYAGTASLTMEDCTLKDGIATNDTKTITYGGNMFSIADVLIINGGTFEGGIAMHAGNLYDGSGDSTVTGTTFKNGVANLNLDGKGNGNGGNVETSSDGDSKFIGCTFEGGQALRGGSVACFGKTTLTNCTIGAGTAVYGGGTLFIYEHGYAIIDGTTTIAGGTCKDTGGAIHMNSFGEKAEANIITDSVKVTGGEANLGDCIYLADGILELIGAPEIDAIHVVNSKETATLNASALTVTKPITLDTSMVGRFGTADTDKIGCFVSGQEWGLKYEDGVLYTHSPRKLYVSAKGSDGENRGSVHLPYKTISAAIAAVEENGTICLVGTVDTDSFAASGKHITITGGEFNITTADRLELRDHITFKDTIFTMPKQNYFIYCNGFTTVIDSTVTVRYLNGTEYTTDSTTSYIYGGSRASYITANGAITGTDLTVLSGVWGYILGGNNENVDMTGDVHLTVGGKVNQGVDYVSHTYSSKYLIIGGSRNADIHGTIYMTVKDGTTGTSINGGSIGECHVDKVELRVTGGEGMAIYGGGRGGVQTIDTINFYYEGGTFEQVFGGSLSYCLTGNVNLYVTGGKITRRVYGGCYSNCDESSGNWTADNFVTGNVNLIIGSGANISCDLTNPNASGITGILTGGKYADRGIYGHSRREAPGSSDAENATIIFLDQTAYNNNKSNLTAQDTIMAGIMNGVSAADLIYYLSWEADDTLDTISHKATAVKDPETGKTGDASAFTKTASMTLSGTSFYYNQNEHTPATVTTSENWDYEAPVLTYANNTEIGTATVTMTVNSHTVTATFDIVKKAEVAEVDGTQYEYLQDAVNAVTEGGYMKILIDCDEDITISKTMYLDLNGKKLTGKVTVAEGTTLYGADATTDDYICSDGYGEIAEVEGDVAFEYKATVDGKIRRYVTYTDPTTGAKSFHRIYLGITSVTLRPGASGMGYKATIAGDAKVVEMMAENAISMTMWVEGNKDGAQTKSISMKDNRMTVSTLVRGIDVEKYSDTALIAMVSVTVNGKTLKTNTVSATLKDAILSAAEATTTYNDAQMSALYDLCSAHAEFLSNWGEVMNNILNWTPATT